MSNSIRVGIIGGAGYTAGELTRILINHPLAEIAYSQSSSNSGKPVTHVHADLIGETDLIFSEDMDSEVDVIFICKGHGQSKTFLESHNIPEHVKIIDLSQDFRLDRGAQPFVYGLPEYNHTQIAKAMKVANPGCFATAIQLSLLPAADRKLIKSAVHISGITGSTGAGQALSATSHFSWRNNNMSVYKALNHQHLLEIKETMSEVWDGFSQKLNFIPYRGNFTRGIIITSYFDTDLGNTELRKTYQAYYSDSPFTHVADQNPDLKMVVNSNKCVVYPSVQDGTAVIISVIDNLVKGASGQAVQNMNLMFGFEEDLGLHLKTIAY